MDPRGRLFKGPRSPAAAGNRTLQAVMKQIPGRKAVQYGEPAVAGSPQNHKGWYDQE